MALDKFKPVAKAIVGFVTPGVVAAVAAVQDGSPGGNAITMPEWVGIVAAMVITGGAVFAVPNKVKPTGLDAPVAPTLADEQPASEAAPAPEPEPAEDPVKAQLKAAIEQVRANSNARNDARAAAATAAVDNAA